MTQWGASILVLLAKTFLLVTGLKVFHGLKLGGSFADNLEIIKGKKFDFPLPWKNYQLGFNSFVIAYLLAVLVYVHLAYLHMYIGYVLEDKIREHLVQVSLNHFVHLPYLQTQVIKSKLRNILYLDIPILSLYFAGGNKGQNFNQIFYQTADTFLTGWLIFTSLQNKIDFLIIIGAIIFTLLLVALLQYLIIKKEKKFKQSLDQENQKIDNLLDNIELLKKKELSPIFFQEIKQKIQKNIKQRVKDKFLIVVNGVYPNHLLPRATGMILFFFTLNIEACLLTDNILRQLKSVLVATWDLPSFLTSSRRFTNFYQMTKLPKQEKTPKIFLREPIKKIELRNICYQYPKQKEYLLKNFNKEFRAGEISKLEGRNGTGKSTSILLILGLLKPQKGQIIINNQFNLQEINLEHWRKQISYCSNQTLLKKGSEGEKQIQELEDALLKDNYSFYDKERKSQVLILDEAWNSMDKNNREEWREKVRNLTKSNKTVTIIIEH